uniref:Protein FAM189B n=1 Tax=Amazona collaria TaxID=241587 RepID=A0A8B9GGH6_9PSIT
MGPGAVGHSSVLAAGLWTHRELWGRGQVVRCGGSQGYPSWCSLSPGEGLLCLLPGPPGAPPRLLQPAERDAHHVPQPRLPQHPCGAQGGTPRVGPGLPGAPHHALRAPALTPLPPQDLLFSVCGLTVFSTIICTLSAVVCCIQIFSLDIVHVLVPQRSSSVTLECTSPPDTFLQSMMDFEEFVPPVPPPPYYPPEYTCSSETDAQRYLPGAGPVEPGVREPQAGLVPPSTAVLLLPPQHHLQRLHGQPRAPLPD